MKTNVSALLVIFSLNLPCLFSQKEFTLLYKSKFSISVKNKGISPNRDFCWATDWKNFCMMDAKTGQVLWTLNMKDKFGIKNADSYEWHDDDKILEIKTIDSKTNEEKSYFIQAASGAVVTATSSVKKYTNTGITPSTGIFLNLKPKKKNMGSITYNGATLELKYKRKLFTGAMKPTETTATIVCSGAHQWEQVIKVKVIRNLFPDEDDNMGGDFLTMYPYADKLFVLYEGLSVLDINTGKLLWETSFDNSNFDFGLFKSTQEIGRAAWPVPDGQYVYIVDLSKENKCIKKLDINTGNLLWKTQEKLDNDEIIPNLIVSGNVLLAQFGGLVEKQTFISKDGSYKKEFIYAGNFGVKAYDISTGKLLWDTHTRESELEDKFKGMMSNLLIDESRLYVGSTKNIYCMDIATGKILFKTPVKEIKLDAPVFLWTYNSSIIAECNKGVATLDRTTGKILFATKTGKCLDAFSVGNNYFVWTGTNLDNLNEFVKLNLNTGSIEGKIENTPYPKFTPDGTEFIKFDNNAVFRYKIN